MESGSTASCAEMGRRCGLNDELSIAHIRYRLDNGQGTEMTVAEPRSFVSRREEDEAPPSPPVDQRAFAASAAGDGALAAAVRDLLPAGVADRCRIQVIVQMPKRRRAAGESRLRMSARPRPTEPC